MEAKFSQRVKDVLSYSREEAIRLGNNYIGLEHLLLGILREGEGLAVQLMKYFGMDLAEVRKMIEKAVANPDETLLNADNIPLVRQAERALKITYLEAKMFNSELIGTEHLLLSILRDEDNIITKFFEKSGVDYDTVREELKRILKGKEADDRVEPRNDLPGDPADEEAEESGRGYGNTTRKPSDSKSKTPVLDNFGRDITKAAEEGRLDPIVGREKELERIAQILSRRKKNNPILIGEPGVGKSAIAEGLAERIVKRKVSRALFDKRIISLDLASLVAGT
ncbi:MAG: AAA family ATPase, partial [Bacteroidales bacterium]|nr:AAA family ATPase [Bacteroidales bacterium]